MNLQQISIYTRSKGFILPNSSIYGNFKGTFDYGPLGCELRHNILNSYRNFFIIPHQNIVEQHGAIISHPKVWEASGHLDNFNDFVAINSKGERHRADHLIEEFISSNKIEVTFNMNDLESMTCDELLEIINKYNISSNGARVISVEAANLIFNTKTLNGTECYLRPETCQNIFVNANLISEINRLALPFGIAQHGKVFRNEISPRHFIFRCREFEQLEMEYFFNTEVPNNEQKNCKEKVVCLFADGTEQEIFVYELEEKIHFEHVWWIGQTLIWLTENIGLRKENLRIREHTEKELSHYSSATFDIEYKYPFGTISENAEKGGQFKELCGIANRGDYDLKQHAKTSSQNLKFKCPITKEKLYPHVIEPSIGVERLFLAILCDAYEYNKERDYEVLHLHPSLCPVEYAIFPLPSKNFPKQQFLEKARNVQQHLIGKNKTTFYDDVGSIGRRYARQDGVGTKWCITVDDITLEYDVVTIRDRDTKEQKRVFFGHL